MNLKLRDEIGGLVDFMMIEFKIGVKSGYS